MRRDEFKYLCGNEARLLIEEHLGEDPRRLALSGLPACVCTQIKLLERCRTKLPLFYRHRCIIPEVSFEQASSQHTALARRLGGDKAIDLTCGLGCDAYFLSRRYRHVTAVERDELLADIARHNFKLLGADNIDVICADSADFVKSLTESFDLIYVDPARRDGTRRLLLLQECSPDVVALADTLCRLSDKIVVKASPLFDVDEAGRLFGSYGSVDVETVSLDGECKEVMIYVAVGGSDAPTLAVTTITGDKACTHRFSRDDRAAAPCDDRTYPYLLLADAAFVKSRTTGLIAARIPGAAPLCEGVILSDTASPYPSLRTYAIAESLCLNRKAKKRLKESGITAATVIKRCCSLGLDKIRQTLGLKEGGDNIVIAATDRLFTVKPLPEQ
ncbi:MAG: class I SAM-dependent methyltransferase [Rikenellaceae bacterium]|nr:class I SAM-dependent methyltransferase [Rikenellaceae bacterium]